MVYRAEKTKSCNDEYKFYFGLTDTAFKERCKNHSRASKYQKYQNTSELVKYNWHLNQNNIRFFLKSRFITRVYGSSSLRLQKFRLR